ncbi:MAG: DUF4434 domain-containing protein [Cyanobacteria bacterium SZAS TMP-1]|nr:DUF4434 domain-containing protein [Cyanobacteria bacterium SZAS TMP-1]
MWLSVALVVSSTVFSAEALARAKKKSDGHDAPAVVPAVPDSAAEPAMGAKGESALPLKFTGAIIRYDRLSMDMTRDQWQQVMDNLDSLGIDTIIIHHHHAVPRLNPTGEPVEEFDFIPADGPKVVVKTADKSVAKTADKPVAVASKVKTKVKSPTPSPAPVAEKGEAGRSPVVQVKAKFDASAFILDFADAHHMKVYMGLWMDPNWYSNLDVTDQLAHTLNRAKYDLDQLKKELTDKKSDITRTAQEIKDAEAEIAVCERGLTTVKNELEEKSLYFAATKDGEIAGPTMKMADTLAKRYGSHPSFAGWYLPEEIWDAAFSTETISVLNPLLKLLSNYCQSISPSDRERPFAMSPKASRLHYDGVDEIYASHLELLKDTGVDILILEDSIGDLNLKEDDDISVRLKKHFTAFSRVAEALKIPLWAVLETFEQQGTVRKPTNLARLKKQFQYSYPYLDKKSPRFFAYDFLRYMSLPQTKYPNPELRAKLFDDYKRDFVDSAFRPQ